MNKIGRIFLSWRKAEAKPRHIVGLMKRLTTHTIFHYLIDGVENASKDGFKPYVDFPKVDMIYTENVLEIFGQRLMSLERSDVSNFLKFWDIDPKFAKDKYYMLAHTQGWLPTDNFEFLAEFYPSRNLKFVTDVAGLSHNPIEKGVLKPDDILEVVKQSKNLFDSNAVLLKKGEMNIGYIKKIHNRVFHHPKSSSLQVRVKALEENGQVKRIFVEVFNKLPK